MPSKADADQGSGALAGAAESDTSIWLSLLASSTLCSRSSSRCCSSWRKLYSSRDTCKAISNSKSASIASSGAAGRGCFDSACGGCCDCRGEQPEEQKEARVLTETSLLNLGKAVKQGDMKLYMLLNIPTVEIVRQKVRNEELKMPEYGAAQKLLLYWKKMRKGAKENDIIRDLDNALRESGQEEIADIVSDRNRIDQEIVPELFRTAGHALINNAYRHTADGQEQPEQNSVSRSGQSNPRFWAAAQAAAQFFLMQSSSRLASGNAIPSHLCFIAAQFSNNCRLLLLASWASPVATALQTRSELLAKHSKRNGIGCRRQSVANNHEEHHQSQQDGQLQVDFLARLGGQEEAEPTGKNSDRRVMSMVMVMSGQGSLQQAYTPVERE
uniref:Death domain-containing protein n=2 Tax=Macrostomum lignano TaxID=282301 RepID=A0A1I8IG32_9PLAT